MSEAESGLPSILIISSRTDVHVSPVADVLDRHQVAWARLNTEDIAHNLTVHIDPASNDASLQVRDSGKLILIRAIRSVWYRKPEPVTVDHFQLEAAGREYVEAEFREVLDGIYALLSNPSVLWINNPFETRISHRKLLQLKVASDIGFRIPKTLLTNDPRSALEFAAGVRWDLAVKSLGSLTVTSAHPDAQKIYGIFTRRINEEEFRQVADKIAYMPSLIQEYIHKSFELRITCVGKKHFGCAIYSQEDESCVEDSRMNIAGLRHEAYEVPQLTRMLEAYMEHFNLQFACFDFAVTPDGNEVFFECNPNGQFLWIEKMTGMGISLELANILMASRL